MCIVINRIAAARAGEMQILYSSVSILHYIPNIGNM